MGTGTDWVGNWLTEGCLPPWLSIPIASAFLLRTLRFHTISGWGQAMHGLEAF
jgi:hypothetical protein